MTLEPVHSKIGGIVACNGKQQLLLELSPVARATNTLGWPAAPPQVKTAAYLAGLQP
jgi:hypothetical protein